MKTKLIIVLTFLLVSCETPFPGAASINSISDIADLSKEEFGNIDAKTKKELEKKFQQGIDSGSKQLDNYMEKSPGSSAFNFNFKTNNLLNQMPLQCDSGEFKKIRNNIKRRERNKKIPVAGKGSGKNYTGLISEYENIKNDLNKHNKNVDILKNLEDNYVSATKKDGQKLADEKYQLAQTTKDLKSMLGDNDQSEDINSNNLAQMSSFVKNNESLGSYEKESSKIKIEKIKKLYTDIKNTTASIEKKTQSFKKELKKNFSNIHGVNINSITNRNIASVSNFIEKDLKVELKNQRKNMERRLSKISKEIKKRDLDTQNEMDKVENESTCKYDKENRKKSLIVDNMLNDKKQLRCDPSRKGVSEEEAANDQNHYNQIVADFENNAHLTRILIRMASNEEMEQHKKALESIPVGLAREAFINAAGMDKSKLILPPGSKDVLAKIKEKYRALQDVTDRLSGLKLLHDKGEGQSNWSAYNPFTAFGNISNSFEQSKKEAMEAIDSYDSINLNEEVKFLKKNKFKFDSPASAELISTGKLSKTKTYLSSLRKIENPLGVANSKTNIETSLNYQKKLDAKIKDLKENQMKDMEKMVAQMFCGSGNESAYTKGASDKGKRCTNPDIASSASVINYLKGSDDEGYDEAEKGKLSERLEEVTGFTFDPDMTFDLIKTTTVDFDDRNFLIKHGNDLVSQVGAGDQYKGERYGQFKNMFENLKNNYSNKLSPKTKKAMTFFDNYEELQKLNSDKNQFDAYFTSPIEELADKLKIGSEAQGGHGHGVFENWRKLYVKKM